MRNLADEMRGHANSIVAMVREEYGRELDFSEQTIGAVESILNAFSERSDKTDDDTLLWSLLFGAYIGEMVRTNFPSAAWKIPESTSPNPPYICVGKIDLYPISWCYKRIVGGPQDSLVKKYLAFREAVDLRASGE